MHFHLLQGYSVSTCLSAQGELPEPLLPNPGAELGGCFPVAENRYRTSKFTSHSLVFHAVILLDSKESQAELGWTSHPSNGVSEAVLSLVEPLAPSMGGVLSRMAMNVSAGACEPHRLRSLVNSEWQFWALCFGERPHGSGAPVRAPCTAAGSGAAAGR